MIFICQQKKCYDDEDNDFVIPNDDKKYNNAEESKSFSEIIPGCLGENDHNNDYEEQLFDEIDETKLLFDQVIMNQHDIKAEQHKMKQEIKKMNFQLRMTRELLQLILQKLN